MIDKKLSHLREEIDQIDQGILKLLQERRKVVDQIMLVKRVEEFPIFDPKREEMLLNKLMDNASESRLDPRFILKLYAVILEDAKK